MHALASALLSLITLTSLLLGLLPSASAADRPPNIVFILADDLGYADISAYGAPDVKTPHIDSLARDGLKFENFYAMGPQCTPSRTAFLTGRYPQRAGGLECAIGTGNVGRYDDAIALAEKGRSRSPLSPRCSRPGPESDRLPQRHLRQVAPRLRTEVLPPGTGL